MRFYRINRRPDETVGEGENWDEWFPSLSEARKRRAQLERENHDAWVEDCESIRAEYGEDSHLPVRHNPGLSIDRVDLADLSAKNLTLAILNQSGFIRSVVRVVEETSK